jgi:hypothetical protein
VGIKVSKSGQVIVRHNTIHDNDRLNSEHLHNGGIFLLAYDTIAYRDTMVVHNTLHRIGNPAYDNAALLIYEHDAPVEGFVFRNNIVSTTVSGVEIEVDTGTFDADHNDYFNPDGFSASWHGALLDWDGYRQASGQDGQSMLSDPEFVDPDGGDFALAEHSPCVDGGGFLTQTPAGGSGTVVAVEDARFFSHGYGVAAGDVISVGGGPQVRVVGVDYDTHELAVDRPLEWEAGDPVSFAFLGQAPDIGAHELGALIFSDGFESGDTSMWSATGG